jgi:hypothetical protein
MQKIHDSEQPERKGSCRAALKKICRVTKESFGLLLKESSARNPINFGAARGFRCKLMVE